MIIGEYKAIYAPNHPKSLLNGYVYEHIIVAEEKLGRPLKKEETVHHVDLNKMNNSLNNLIVFTSKAEHTKFHHYNCDEKILILLEDGSYKCSTMSKNICPLCGEQKERHANVCRNCYYNEKYNRKVKDRPSREELKELLRKESFLRIGYQYGVSDNAIRKWCDAYNLPRKRQDIKNYTDEEWEKI